MNEYYKNLPKKRMAAGALIMNSKEEILIVKPSYKDYWTWPGGVIEADESPKSGCLREIKEEIGLDLVNVEFLGVDYTSENQEKSESLQFMFFGGKLSLSQIKKIKVDGEEIVDYKFMKIDEALALLSDRIKLRLPRVIEALKNNRAVYLEDGR